MPVEFKTKHDQSLSSTPQSRTGLKTTPFRRFPIDRRINLDPRIKVECVEIVDLDAIHLKRETQGGTLKSQIATAC